MGNSEAKKRLISNFFSLSVLQGANYILPLITLPYLVRVLGPEKFGLIMFAQAFIQYFIILTDYGFNLSATREISVNRENKEKVSEIFSSVMIIKLLFLLLSFIILTAVVFSFEKFRKDWIVYYLTFGIVIGNALFPTWLFQGLENMKYITFLNLLSKIVFTVFIFVFIHETADYIYVPLINSIGFIVSGLLSIWIVLSIFKIRPKYVNLSLIIYHLKEGWHVFIATVATALYTTSNTFILGLFTNNTIVGYFSAAEKIIKAIQNLFIPISQATYPYISKLIQESREAGIKFIRKLTLFIGLFSLILSIILFLFPREIIFLILGNKYKESVIVLKIIAFLPFLIALSNIFGIQTMLALNFKKAFSRILILASIINILLSVILVPIFKHIGVSISVLCSETFVTLSMFIFLERKGVKILEGKMHV